MVYIVEGPKYTHKRHQNQLQKRCLNNFNEVPQTKENPIDTIFDIFDLDPPQSTPEIRRSGRKRKFTDLLMINAKRKKYYQHFYKVKGLGGCCGSLNHITIKGLFSPLLVLRDFAAREADQYRCYLNSTRLLTFSM